MSSRSVALTAFGGIAAVRPAVSRRLSRARRARVRRNTLEKVRARSDPSHALAPRSQGLTAFYGPGAMEIYRAESALSVSERNLNALLERAREDERALEAARERWWRSGRDVRERRERANATALAYQDAKKALDKARELYEEANRARTKARGELEETERQSVEAASALSVAEAAAQTHSAGIADAKAEVSRLRTAAEKAISSLGTLKLPF